MFLGEIVTPALPTLRLTSALLGFPDRKGVTMLAEQEVCIARAAVGVFKRTQDFQGAIDDLLTSGFDRTKVTLLTSEHAVQEKLRQRYQNISALARDPVVHRPVYHSTDAVGIIEAGLIAALYSAAMAATGAVMFHGTFATVIGVTATAATAGALIGAILAKCVEVRREHRLQAQVDRGGLLLWVGTRSGEDEKRAVKILKMHSADDVHLAPPAANYRTQMGLVANTAPGPRYWRHGPSDTAAYAEEPRRSSELAIRQRNNVDGTS